MYEGVSQKRIRQKKGNEKKIYEIMMKTLPISILNHLPTNKLRYRHLQIFIQLPEHV
jgi:hypothetical protein